MNALSLNGVPSAFVEQKGLDTVQKRHHVRVWQHPQRANVWLGAAAEDIGFRFKLMHWTHSREFRKIVHRLTLWVRSPMHLPFQLRAV